MIEIIGSKTVEEKEPGWRKLPKNVRQIGEAREKRKVYIEDYVMTYLGRLAQPGQAYARGAILFGDVYNTEDGEAVFISAAMEAQNLELDMDDTIFTDDIWRELLKKGESYFPGQKVMGWFLSRMGFSVEMNQKIVHTHTKNFPGDHKILYMIDSLEKEDAVYIFENGQMIRQKGYYIYYEKNSPMQEYMLAGKKMKKERTEVGEKVKDVSDFRDKGSAYKKKRYKSDKKKNVDLPIYLTRIASVAAIFVMSIYIYNEMIELNLINDALKVQVIETIGKVGSVFSEENETVEEVWIEEELTESTTEDKDSKDSTEERAELENNTENEVATKEGETEETLAAFESQKPMYYIVEKGDTLAAISRKMYLSDKYTKQIAWANSLSNADEIYEGQKILIPAIP